MKKTLLLTVVAVFLLMGCKTVVRDHCALNAAALAGVNDAKHNKAMENNYAQSCQGNQAQINAAYHQGYLLAILSERNAITNGNGAKQAQAPAGQQCVEFGDNKACGYHCMKSIKMVKCASVPSDNCVGDNSGNLACGVNCRVEVGQIKCDKER